MNLLYSKGIEKMTENQYREITHFFRKSKFRSEGIKILCKYSQILIIMLYMCTSIFLYLKIDKRLILFLIIPALNLIFVSIFRKILNKPRPYDTYDYEPLVDYEKGKGQSFPSRHTASAFIIAMACLYLNHTYGFIVMFIAIIVGVTRVLAGVHYPTDVIGGAVISILFGVVGFFISV
ncbi:phosphatase PAP2 family protein [Clostridium neonatale]|uniref:phosphatase PAP2 family protein n=1 Tax=Clostridium neonatale TaxID=137838 RepID=UPI0029372300|nr:phosphatase PAP2 family protein [Clostridium neonatale]